MPAALEADVVSYRAGFFVVAWNV